MADHLGSVAVITDEMGSVVERLAYDAWGKRRHPNGADDPTGSITSQTTKGFTGHEHIASVGLINMNARIYDPQLGRFMAADPMVENLYLSQILNRYSYVGNNPLSFTDPTGNSFLSDLWKQDWFRQIVAFFVSNAINDPEIVGIPGLADSTTRAVVAGAAAGAIVGGSVEAAIVGGLQNLAFTGIHAAKEEFGIKNGSGLASAMHGLVGGLASVALGGKFRAGFLAAGMAEASSFGAPASEDPWIGLIRHTIAGGFGSVLGGGKFGNGALTGAFGYLFNHLLDGSEWSSQQEEIGGRMNCSRNRVCAPIDDQPLGHPDWILEVAAIFAVAPPAALPYATVRAGGSVAGEVAAPTFIRLVETGTGSLAIQQAKNIQFTQGVEAAIVRLSNGERWLVSGGAGGIDFSGVALKRLIFHTHPINHGSIGPSAADIAAIRLLGQTRSYVYDGAGQIIKFTPK